MTDASTPGKLLIAFAGKHRAEDLMAAAKRAGARGGTVAMGQTTADNKLLQWLSLADVDEDVLFMALGPEADAVKDALRRAADADPKRLAGMAVVMGASFCPRPAAPDAPNGKDAAKEAGTHTKRGAGRGRETPMESGKVLINIIVNSGFGEDVMAAARGAGASGGTLLGAHGTGTAEDVKFFGITLVPEKDMLLILADRDKAGAIVDAVRAIPDMTAPGGGIVFMVNVEEVIPLGDARRTEAE